MLSLVLPKLCSMVNRLEILFLKLFGDDPKSLMIKGVVVQQVSTRPV